MSGSLIRFGFVVVEISGLLIVYTVANIVDKLVARYKKNH